MARNYFSYTVVKADQTLNTVGAAVLTSLSNIEWIVYKISSSGSPNTEKVFVSRTGQTGLEAGSINSTSYNGLIEFWAEPGEYKIAITDPLARVGSKEIFWNSVSGQDGGIPGTKISNDDSLISNQIADGTIATADIGGLQVTNAKLAADSVTTAKIADLQVTGVKIADNVLPLGSVIDWYRAVTSISVPPGWAVCDGRDWSLIDNQMGVSKAALVSGEIPNLIGKFTIGARLTVASGGSGGAADTTNSTNGTEYANAPGIGGFGGSNAARNLVHSHSVPSHYHSPGDLGTEGGTHSNAISGGVTGSGDHGHGLSIGGIYHSAGGTYDAIALAGGANFTLFRQNIAVTGGGAHGHGNNFSITGNGAHSHTFTGNVGNTAGVNGNNQMTTGQELSALVDVRPAHVGLLKIMKVKIV